MGAKAGPRRARSLQEKHIEMAIFLAETGTVEFTKTKRMYTWNAQHPAWQYTDAEGFDREARQAYKHLTGRIWMSPRCRATRLTLRSQ